MSVEKINHEFNEKMKLDDDKLSNIKDDYNNSLQLKGVKPRDLTEEESEKLENDKELVAEFKHKKFEKEAKKNWDLFYRRNKTNFFKDRYWTFREFDELNHDPDSTDSAGKISTLLEIGCGVGNFIYPLIKHNKSIYVYACDFSTDAIQLLKSNADYDESRCYGFVCDITQMESLKNNLKDTKVDVVTMIFVLSAVHPSKMRNAVFNIAQVLKPGGILMIRDYGLNDHSMIRFDPGHKLADHFYVRQDGTRTYFFSLEDIDQLFLTDDFRPVGINMNDCDLSGSTKNLFEKSYSEYVFRETVNIKENLRVPRVFIQSKFIRTNNDINLN